MYEEFKQPTDTDTPSQAQVRAKIYLPEVICCTAYDRQTIFKEVSEVGIVNIMSKPPQYQEV